MVPNSTSELTKENWVKILWEEVCKANGTAKNKGKAPISKVDLDKKQAHVNMVTRYAKIQSNSSNRIKASNMKKELPSFINLEGGDKEVLKLPSQYHPSPIAMDTANIQTLMSTPIKGTLTFAEILKVKPELWQEVTTCLEKMGVLVPDFKPI